MTPRPRGRASAPLRWNCRWMKRGHYGNPWRLKLRLTSASAVTPGGFPPRPAAGSGQKKVTCGLLGVSTFIRLRSPTAAQPFTIKQCQPIRPRRSGKPRRLNWHLSARATPAAWRCWRQSRRTSSSSERRKKNPKRRKPLGVRRSSNLGFGPSSRGASGGWGSRPVRLNPASQQRTPLRDNYAFV